MKASAHVQTSAPSQIVLSVDSVEVSYGKYTVIEGASFSVKAGECFGLMGVNGAGKTSLIKSILGLKKPSNGTIKVFGTHNQNTQSKKNIAFLPERFEPPWFLTGLEFIKFSLNLYKRLYEEDKILAMADQIDLDCRVLTSRVYTYSKGMRQKLGILATFLSECPLMIFDEPMSGLDPMARTQVKNIFKHEHEKGRTIFISSHILVDMEELCDRVSLMHNKTISAISSPDKFIKTTKEKSLERAFLKLIV